MKHVEQGNQHVLVLTDAELHMLKRMVLNGCGDAPEEIGARTGGEQSVWNRLSQWAFSGKISD